MPSVLLFDGIQHERSWQAMLAPLKALKQFTVSFSAEQPVSWDETDRCFNRNGPLDPPTLLLAHYGGGYRDHAEEVLRYCAEHDVSVLVVTEGRSPEQDAQRQWLYHRQVPVRRSGLDTTFAHCLLRLLKEYQQHKRFDWRLVEPDLSPHRCAALTVAVKCMDVDHPGYNTALAMMRNDANSAGYDPEAQDDFVIEIAKRHLQSIALNARLPRGPSDAQRLAHSWLLNLIEDRNPDEVVHDFAAGNQCPLDDKQVRGYEKQLHALIASFSDLFAPTLNEELLIQVAEIVGENCDELRACLADGVHGAAGGERDRLRNSLCECYAAYVATAECLRERWRAPNETTDEQILESWSDVREAALALRTRLQSCANRLPWGV